MFLLFSVDCASPIRKLFPPSVKMRDKVNTFYPGDACRIFDLIPGTKPFCNWDVNRDREILENRQWKIHLFPIVNLYSVRDLEGSPAASSFASSGFAVSSSMGAALGVPLAKRRDGFPTLGRTSWSLVIHPSCLMFLLFFKILHWRHHVSGPRFLGDHDFKIQVGRIIIICCFTQFEGVSKGHPLNWFSPKKWWQRVWPGENCRFVHERQWESRSYAKH